jgi:hypothetical protein
MLEGCMRIVILNFTHVFLKSFAIIRSSHEPTGRQNELKYLPFISNSNIYRTRFLEIENPTCGVFCLYFPGSRILKIVLRFGAPLVMTSMFGKKKDRQDQADSSIQPELHRKSDSITQSNVIEFRDLLFPSILKMVMIEVGGYLFSKV